MERLLPAYRVEEPMGTSDGEPEDTVRLIKGGIKEMTQEETRIARRPQQELAVPITKEQAMYLLRTIWPKAPETEVIKAGILCQQYGLNPLMRQVYLVQFGSEWVTVLGIKATRQIAQQALRKQGIRYTYADGPRVMNEKEQMEIRGKLEPDKIWAITILNDQAGNAYPGYGFWPANKQPYGTDKGNDALNMAFIRSERNALDKLAPGELPDIEVSDDTYIEGNYRVAIEKGKQEFIKRTEKDIDDLWGEEPNKKESEAPTSTLHSANSSGIAEGTSGNLQEEPERASANDAGLFNISDLTEQLKQAKWTPAQVVSWMKSKANYQGLSLSGSFPDIIKRLDAEQTRFLSNEIISRMEMA